MIKYCADDVGLNPEQIRRVADCAENSALNVASIFGNSPSCFFRAILLQPLLTYSDSCR